MYTKHSNVLSLVMCLGPRALIAKNISCGMSAFDKNNKSAERDWIRSNFCHPKKSLPTVTQQKK